MLFTIVLLCVSVTVNILMRLIYRFVTLAPMPLFLLGFLASVFFMDPVCGAISWEMPAMWLIMALAHLQPWILICQQLYLSRHT